MPRFLTAIAGLLLTLASLVFAGVPASAATLTVPAQYATIQAAINASVNGDTVLIADGTYTGPGNVDLDFGGRNITVTSQNGAASTIIDCGGSAGANHRGFYLHSGETSAVISGLTIENGFVGGPGGFGIGGGIFDSGAGLTVQNCILKNNTASEGGGISVTGNYPPAAASSGVTAIINCVITSNAASQGSGGGLFITGRNGTVNVMNCTLTGNSVLTGPNGGSGSAIYNGGFDYFSGSSGLTLTNDILYGDIGSELGGGNATVNFCDIQGGSFGTGNINLDPLFVFPPNMDVPPDLHLQIGSPCAGAGIPSGAPTTDLDGNSRPNPPSIGAYEAAAVGTAPTTTALTSSLNPSSGGQSVTFTATVTAPAFDPIPTGRVIFTIDGTPQAVVNLTNTGPAAYTVSNLAGGSHTLTATYSGNTFFAASKSSVLPQTVNAPATATVLTSSLNPSSYSQYFTFTATVTGSSPTGTVTLTDTTTNTTLGTANLSNGIATFYTYNLTVGSHQIVASYSGDTSNSSSKSTALTQIINQASTTTYLYSSLNPSFVGQSVTFTANISGGGTLTGTVIFTVDGVAQTPMSLSNGYYATYTTSALTIGSHTITATYSGDTNNTASTSTTLTQIVKAVSATTTALTSSLNPSSYGQQVAFTATVTGSSPTGTVTLTDTTTNTTLGTATLSGSVATFYTYNLTVGSHQIVASYSGDTGNTASNSIVLTQTINQATTTTSLYSRVNPSVVGQSVSFSAYISEVTSTTANSGTLTGTVTFTVDGVAQTPMSLTNGYNVAYTTSALTIGSHTITATYSGDIGNTASTSATLTQIVKAISATTTALTSSQNPSSYGKGVVFTATVTGSNPTGIVTFTDTTSNTTLGTANLSGGVAALWGPSNLALGSHQIVATYGGDTGNTVSNSTSLTQIINQAITTTYLFSSLSPSGIGQNVTFAAYVYGNGGETPTGTVTFTVDGIAQTTVTYSWGYYATYTTSALSVGPHIITATYNSGDTNYASSTPATLTQIVNAPATTTALSSSLNPSSYDQKVTFTATVTGSSPTGTVTFTDATANTTLGTGTLSGGTATFSTSGLTPGSHQIVASYGGDGSNAVSVSSALTQTVTLTVPTQLAATAGYRQVKLTWVPVPVSSGVTYNVYRGTVGGGEGVTPIASNLATAAYTDTGLTDGTLYFYTVRASAGSGVSSPSNEALATPFLPVPAGLAAVAGAGQVALSWTAPAGVPNPAYSVYRGTTPGGETFYKTAGSATTFLNGLVTPGTTYYYTVKTVIGSETSAASGEASATPPVPAPTAPTALTATAGDGRVTLSWTAPAGTVASYSVYRGTSASALTLMTSGLTTTGFTDTAVTNGTVYFYAVAAVGSGGSSPKSSVVSATPQGVPAAPAKLTATVSGGQVLLNWTAPAGPVTSYSVYRGTSPGTEVFYKTAGTATTFTNGLVTKGTKYYYVIRAVNSVGTGPASNEASATP